MRTVEVNGIEDVPASLRDTPVEALLRAHNLGENVPGFDAPALVVGTCMDWRITLRLPNGIGYVVRTGGANLRPVEPQVSFAVAVAGVRWLALIAHTQCAMAGIAGKRDAFVEGLREAGWDEGRAAAQFDELARRFEIGHEVRWVLEEAARLRELYPAVNVAALLYRVEDHRLALVEE